jgi:mono/diheme cytochrome c family protein
VRARPAARADNLRRALARKLQKTRRAAAVAGALAALALTGCGRDSSADLANGKKLFIGKGTCGSCHTLARAGTRGTQGPNLDAAFENARRHGFGDTVIEGIVRDQIKIPRRGSIMPANLVRGDDRRDVAAYVAQVAGKPGQDTGLLASVGTTNNANKVAVEKGGKLVIPADPSGALAFTFGKAQGKPGPATIEMPNQAPIQHDIAIKGPASGKGPTVGKGGVSSFKVTLKPGNYEFLCTVPGHEAGGMKGTLTVK